MVYQCERKKVCALNFYLSKQNNMVYNSLPGHKDKSKIIFKKS